MKIIVRNAKGVNVRAAPVDGGIIKLALAGSEFDVDGVISIHGDLWAKLSEPLLYQNKPVTGYVVVRANLIQYCWFVAESVDEPSEYNRGWNDCLDAMPRRK